MKNTLTDLNNALFAEIENLQDADLTPEQLDAVLRRSAAVSKVAEVIVRNAELSLKVVQHMNEYAYSDRESSGRTVLAPLPVMLETR